nr:signal recognition particle receptor subunit alpha homolog [Quercus suber]XP_023913283.1 signal recognition particle receptor subunit alpha homolog [Quercus suber]XP_023927183.1 signal recognition particle receptor subunit alpha homolog [Quercus suber]
MRALSKLISLHKPDLVLFVGEALVGNDAVDQLSMFDQCRLIQKDVIAVQDYLSNTMGEDFKPFGFHCCCHHDPLCLATIISH